MEQQLCGHALLDLLQFIYCSILLQSYFVARLTAYLIALNYASSCIIKSGFFCFASAQKKSVYIYICIHSINKCLVKEQILSDTHTYGIS